MESYFDIKATPSSGKQGFKLDKNGQLKGYLKSPPEKNKANNELIELLSKSLNLPKSTITITAGLTSRKKRIRITAVMSFEQLLEKLGLGVIELQSQKTIF